MNIVPLLKSVRPSYSECEVNILAEAAYNTVYGVVPLTDKELEFFKQNKTNIRILLSAYSHKRKLNTLTEDLVQHITAALCHLDG